MATFTAVGPALDLDGPLPVAPEYSLLSSAADSDNDPVITVITTNERVFNGLNVWGYPTNTPSLWEPCSSGTYRDKNDDYDADIERFDGLVAYQSIVCSTITQAPEETAMRAQVALNAKLSFAVEQALAKGVTGSTNPYLGDSHLTQLGGAAVLPQAGLNFLENAIGATGSQGVIHATPGVVSAWNFVNLVTDNGEGHIETANGTTVVSGGGYINTDPAGKTGSDPTVGQEWAFATGPLKIYLAESVTLSPAQYIERDTNTITFRAERYVLPLWDTSLQSGVLIDWTP